MRFRHLLPITLSVLLIAGTHLAPRSASSSPVNTQRDQDIRGMLSESAERVPGQVVVKYRTRLAADAAATLATDHGIARSKSIDLLGIHLFTTEPGREIETIRRLQADSRVEFAEPNYVERAIGHITPGDPLYATDQADLPLIRMPDAWHLTVGSSSVIVAVIDTGIDFGHPDLSGRIVSLTGAALPGADHVFISSAADTCPSQVRPDDDPWTVGGTTHGTHVSGTIAARSTIAGGPSEGIAGIAPGVRIAPVKALDCEGSGTSFDIDSAITFASTNGASIINMSLGSSGDISACTRSRQTAMDAAYARGAFIAAAAGNDGTSNRSSPAICNHVVGVGATNNSDVRASFSQFNRTVDVSAPGVGTMSTVRNSDGSRGYSRLSGTSMATPHVAGCAALIRSIAANLSPDQVEAILRTTAVDLGPAGRDDFYGAGRLNCGAAVQGATGAPPPTTTPAATVQVTSTPTRVPPTVPPPSGPAVSCATQGTFPDSRPASAAASSNQERPVLSAARSSATVATLGGVGAARTRVGAPYTGASSKTAHTESAASGPGWSVITCETFEASWPSSGWQTFDNNGTAGGSYCWNDVAFQPRFGARSAWPAAGCANGVNPAQFFYPNNVDSWMTYGPFSLADAVDADVHFSLWAQMESGFDSLFWGASTNDEEYFGFQVTGSSTTANPPTSNGWLDVTFDLKDVPTLGNLVGQSAVWVAWAFVSDAQVVDDGPFIDDVLIHKLLGSPTATDNARARSGPYSFTVGPGQELPEYEIVFENSGTTTWRASDAYTLREEVTAASFALSGCDGLQPRQACTFSFPRQTISPQTPPGSYGYRFRMQHSNAGFGDTITVSYVVSTGGAPTRTPTPPPSGGSGGRGFALSPRSGGAALSWQPGAGPTGYLVVRISPAGNAALPSAGPLSASATSYFDATPLTGVTCYLLLVLGPTPGNSDLLCVIANTRSPIGGPQDFTIQVNAPNQAGLSWTGPLGGGQDGYLLVPLGGTALTRSGSETNATLPMSGATCFALFATRGGAALGNADVLCAIPGLSTL